MFDGLIRMLIIIGIIIGLLIFGVPAYFIGKYAGKQAVYSEAQYRKVL